MDLKNSMLLANMLTRNGGGIDFKTYCYAIDNAYIQTDISANGDYKIRLKGKILVDTFNIAGGVYPFEGFTTTNSGSKYLGTYMSLATNPNGYINTLFFRSINNDYPYNPTYQNNLQVGNGNNEITTHNFDLTLSHTIPCDVQYKLFKSSSSLIAFEIIQIKDQNDNLLHELKPTIINGESGMYDTVTQTFYGNSNSVGSLVCE